ncbi:MAG: AhpC/TSA family protein [Dysgonamonadaceae bacterium]|jgi:peroxiredoxin|nr:AhpC/TSA family protein [Dysgonamonadaceae bacterium]
MRKIIFFTLLWTVTLNSCAKAEKGNRYEIKGKIGNYGAPAKIYLQYIENNELITRFEPLNQGQFSFSGSIQTPARGRLVVIPDGSSINNQKQYEHTMAIIVDSENMEISSPDVIANATITGSQVNNELKKLNEQLKIINDKKNSLIQEYYDSEPGKQQDTEFLSFVQKKMETIENEFKSVYQAFIKNNPNSYVSLMILLEYKDQVADATDIDSLFHSLSQNIQNTQEGKALATMLSQAKTTAIGSVAPDFTQNDPDGKPVKLSDFRGKYLLVDFWASWCGPCRKENPNVVKAYNQYKDKNFEILGVSLDNPGAKQNWLNAIQKDGLTWKQVSDLKGWQNAVALQYNIQSIPQNLLLDPQGIIIAKNLRGENLVNTLEKILK